MPTLVRTIAMEHFYHKQYISRGNSMKPANFMWKTTLATVADGLQNWGLKNVSISRVWRQFYLSKSSRNNSSSPSSPALNLGSLAVWPPLVTRVRNLGEGSCSPYLHIQSIFQVLWISSSEHLAHLFSPLHLHWQWMTLDPLLSPLPLPSLNLTPNPIFSLYLKWTLPHTNQRHPFAYNFFNVFSLFIVIALIKSTK